jgi:hypothetical protein
VWSVWLFGTASVCDLNILNRNITRRFNAEFGGLYSRITWTRWMTCAYVGSVTVSTYAVDRTWGYDGQVRGQIFQGTATWQEPSSTLTINVFAYAD